MNSPWHYTHIKEYAVKWTNDSGSIKEDKFKTRDEAVVLKEKLFSQGIKSQIYSIDWAGNWTFA